MDKLQHPRRRQCHRRRDRYRLEYRGDNQRHESPRHTVAGAVEEHKVVDIADPPRPIEIAADKVLRLPDGAGLAEMLRQPFRRWQEAPLDGAGIGDRIAEIAIGLGKLPFLFLEVGDIGTGAAIADETAFIVKDRYAADADMHRFRPAADFIFESPELPSRLEIGDMLRKGDLNIGLRRDLLARMADHVFLFQTRDLEEPLGDEGQAKLAVHLEKPVTRDLRKFAKPFLAVGEPVLRPFQPSKEQARRRHQRVVGLHDGTDFIIIQKPRTHRIVRRRGLHRLAERQQRVQDVSPETDRQTEKDHGRQNHHHAADDEGLAAHRGHQQVFVDTGPEPQGLAVRRQHRHQPVRPLRLHPFASGWREGNNHAPVSLEIDTCHVMEAGEGPQHA